MKPNYLGLLSLVAFLALLAITGCSERDLDTLEPATAPANPVVFSDAFLGGLDYAAFEYSYYEAFTIDEAVVYDGLASLKVSIPDGETWAAGSFYSQGPRDLSEFNALTFWARASRDYTLNSAGFGIGIIAPSDYQGEITNVPLTTTWTQIVIPIPNSARMTLERGLFWYSATTSDGPVDIWFDEVEFANLSSITNPRPVMPTRSIQALVGGRFEVPGTRTTFTVGDEERTVYHTFRHFDYFSGAESVVTADGDIITAVSLGETTITAMLGETEVQGEITAKVVADITQPYVFFDALDTGLNYGSFGESWIYLAALSIDDTGGLNDSPSIKITIPDGNDAGGAAFSTEGGRDLTSFNALVFDARADQAGYVLGSVGYGIGLEAGGTDFQVGINEVELDTAWRRIIVPIPDSTPLTAEAGVWWFYAGQTGNIWIDNIQFATLDESELSNPQPVMTSESVTAAVGDVVTIGGTIAEGQGPKTTFTVDGTDEVVVEHTYGYFNFVSSDESVAVVSGGIVTVVGTGTATITATLGATDVVGDVTVTVAAPPVTPSAPAPTPTHAAGDVISLFSDAYDDITVDNWCAWPFGGIAVADEQIDGDNVKVYTNFNNPAFYCVVEFTGIDAQIDATTFGATHLHMDVFGASGTQFGCKPVDFGADGGYQGGDDTEFELVLDAGTDPAFVAGEWVSLEIPLSAFEGMNFGNVAQLVFTKINTGTVWIDNVYFHR